MRSLIISAMTITISLAAAAAQAVEVLDQQNDVTPSATADSTSGGILEQGQTFTVGVTGTLSRIAVQINFPGFGSSGNAILNVYSTSSGLPTGTSLGTASLPSSAIPSGTFAFQSFDLSSYGIMVHAGDLFAYSISSSADSYFFERSTFDHSTYAGGQSVWRTTGTPPGAWTVYSPTHDGGFQTYVVPAPAGLPGDFNDNGAVDAADYVTWRDHLGDPTDAALNGNGDGAGGVDQGDYALWRLHFASSAAPASAAAVPEPAEWMLLAAATVCLKAARRRKKRPAVKQNPPDFCNFA